LPQLVLQLKLAGCSAPDRRFTIVSGDDLTTLREPPSGNVTLDYTTLTFPAAWLQCTGAVVPPDMLDQFAHRLTADQEALDDGHAVIRSSDALTTIASAAEQALTDHGPNAAGHAQVTRGDVWRELSRTGHPITGASGQIDVANAQRIDLTNARADDHRFVAVVERIGTARPQMVYHSGSLVASCLSGAGAP
jgi:hypothetical protein